MLCHIGASHVLERIAREDQKLCDSLLTAYGVPRYQYARDTLDALKNLLGAPRDRFVREADRFARLIVFERERLRPRPPPKIEIQSIDLAPLSATSSWVGIECVDDRQPPRPVPNIGLEIITASGDVRSAHTNEHGTVFVDRIAPGSVAIRVISLDGRLWRPTDAPGSIPSRNDDRVQWRVVEPGQTLLQIASRVGLVSWREVWEHAKNQKLRKRRAHPSRVLPGDDVVGLAVSGRGVAVGDLYARL